MKYFAPVRPKLVPKLKVLKIYWNLAHFVFRISDLDFNGKDKFYEIFTTCSAQISPKIKSTQNLLKYSTLDISNMPNWILMSNMIFMKYLPPVRSKLVPKWKMLRIYWNLVHLIFQICSSRFCCQKWFLLHIYPLLDLNWLQN